ncbi:MAG TPA: CdaR family protein [Candidatus Dormibacteraeota bacterium]|nr:CdaR family protein [Candidatus Dormibacteraeota bacterium]
MSWGLITDQWRIKLLALGLAVLLLGAVAFSQNPPTTGSLTVPLLYSKVPAGVVILNPPPKILVTYIGPSFLLKDVNVDHVTATVDASHAKPGQAVRLNVTAATTILDVDVQNPAPIVVQVDDRRVKALPVQVAARAAPGWSISKAVAVCGTNPCTINFDGPASWETNLVATVDYPYPVGATTSDTPNLQVTLSNSSGFLDLTTCRTSPCAQLDVTSVGVHIDAVAGSTSSTIVLLDSPPSHGPAPGYRVTDVKITPTLVTISGDPAALAKIRNITLPPVDLTGKNTNALFQVAIPYPDGISGNVANASVTYTIARNPTVTPSP